MQLRLFGDCLLFMVTTFSVWYRDQKLFVIYVGQYEAPHLYRIKVQQIHIVYVPLNPNYFQQEKGCIILMNIKHEIRWI